MSKPTTVWYLSQLPHLTDIMKMSITWNAGESSVWLMEPLSPFSFRAGFATLALRRESHETNCGHHSVHSCCLSGPGGNRGEDHRRAETRPVRQGGLFVGPVSYTHLRAHETRHDLVCRLLL